MQDGILVSVSVVFKPNEGKPVWFIIQNDDGEWELPKTLARPRESSVRASIRAMAEQGGMDTKVLEEVGRSGGAAKINGKPVIQRYLYYLMVWRLGGEVLEYGNTDWLEYAKAARLLSKKRDKQMLNQAKKMVNELKRHEDWEERIKPPEPEPEEEKKK